MGESVTVTVKRPLVGLVDDDESCASRYRLLRELGYLVAGFSSAEDFLALIRRCTRCLILDIVMPALPTRSATGVDGSRARDSDHLHHRSSR